MGDYGGEGEESGGEERAVHMLSNAQTFSLLTSPESVSFKYKVLLRQQSRLRHGESRREEVRERDEDGCNRVRECEGERERGHVIAADQSSPSASRI